jgi:hypothetical protein
LPPPAAPASTTTGVTSSLNPSIHSQAVTFTATVSSAAGTPAGTVTFYDFNNVLGTGALNGRGVATYTPPGVGLSVGTHLITAIFSDSTRTYASSIAPPLVQTVNPATTSTTLTSSLNPSAQGQEVTFTATVASTTDVAGPPGGTVDFYRSDIAYGVWRPISVGLRNGTAAIWAQVLYRDDLWITALYRGDGTFSPSTSAPLDQIIR